MNQNQLGLQRVDTLQCTQGVKKSKVDVIVQLKDEATEVKEQQEPFRICSR